MSEVRLEIPEEVLISLKTDAETFGQDIKMLAAVKLFELGKPSSGQAAQLAGMTRVEFLLDSLCGRAPDRRGAVGLPAIKNRVKRLGSG